MSMLKAAAVILGDTRREFYQTRMGIVDSEKQKLLAAYGETVDLFVPEIVYDAQQALGVADEIRSRNIKAVIVFLPIWGTPNLAFRIAASTDLPVLILGNERPDSSSLVTLLAVAGMLDQTGKACMRLAGDLDNKAFQKQVLTYIRSCNLVDGIRRSSFCQIGGRSIGIGTAVADPSQWQSVFGVEFDHRDQYEIVYRAQAIEISRVEAYRAWIEKSFSHREFGGLFTEDTLDRQIRSYLALKDIAEENHYDFMGVKCQQEMSDHFVLQCLGVALLNNSYDAEGKKKAVPTSCESDCDGALTMRLLSLCAGGLPSNLVDIKFFNGQTRKMILANCGCMAPYFAEPDDAGTAMEKITLMPHVFGKAGGASMQMIAKEGEVTVARLYRSNGRYVLGCFVGNLEMKEREELRKTTWCYPHEFVSADIDYDKFFRTINSNHLHTVYGNHTDVLEQFCSMVGIDYICYNTDKR